jgi:hypothetical protein
MLCPVYGLTYLMSTLQCLLYVLSLTFDNRPITLHDSVLLHDSTAVAVAKGFVLPRDRALLTDKSDTDVVNDSLAFSIQGAVSTSDMA